MIEDIKEESLVGVSEPDKPKREECISLKCCAIIGNNYSSDSYRLNSNYNKFQVQVKKSEIVGYSFDCPDLNRLTFFLSNGLQLIVADKWNRYSVEKMFDWKSVDSVGY